MVYRGRPSRGCETCRTARVRCDEARPQCARCRRLRKTCTGYRQLDSLIVCNETEKIRQDHMRGKLHVCTKIYKSHLDTSIPYSDEDVVVWHFYHTITKSLSRADHAFQLHSELPNLYTKSSARSALRLSTQAIAYAVSCRSSKPVTRNARKAYADACLAINLALRNPREAETDEVLYAVLLLCGYETVNRNSDQLGGWATHVSGVASLLSHRGPDSLKRRMGLKLYHFARRSIILHHIQCCRSAAAFFKCAGYAFSVDENEEDRLYSIMETLSDVQNQAATALDPSADFNECSASALLADALMLDRRLSDWNNNLSSAWSYLITKNRLDSGTKNLDFTYSPTEIHQYRSVFHARLLNLYRLCRIVLYMVMIRAETSSNAAETRRSSMIEIAAIQTNTYDLVNDICSSVQYLSGHDMAKRLSPEGWSSTSDPSLAHVSSRSHVEELESSDGRYSLLWILYVASSVPFICESQRKWMNQQLVAIGETGETLALNLAASRSQLLFGRAEDFTIDCV